MDGYGVGDLSRFLFSAQRSGALQRDLSRLTEELGTGRKQDLTAAVRGDFGRLGLLEQQLSALDAYSEARSGLDLTYTTARLAYDGLLSTTKSLGADLLSAIGLNQPVVEAERIDAARHEFSSAVGRINSRIGDSYVFSGVNSNSPPLIDAESMLADLRTAVSTAVTAADFVQIVDDWFLDTLGGFETSAYLGGDQLTGRISVGPSETVAPLETALDPAFRDLLKDLAKVTLLSEGAFSGNITARREIAQVAGEGLLASNQLLIGNAARLGTREAQLEQVSVQGIALKTGLETARASLREIDPFATATELQSVQQQIESFYVITARTARLKLTEFLR